MAAVEWSFVEDGSLSVGEQTVDLAYHPKLNTILAVTEEPGLRVLDVNSGVTLQKSSLSGRFIMAHALPTSKFNMHSHLITYEFQKHEKNDRRKTQMYCSFHSLLLLVATNRA